MSKKTVIYGDVENTNVFENPNESFEIENGKVLSNETYREELLKIYNESFTKTIKTEINVGDDVSGTIDKMTKEDIILDVGGKEYVYVSVTKDKVNLEAFSIGDEMTVSIVENKEYLKGSLLEYTRKTLYSEMKSKDNKKVYDAYVVNLSENGYNLNIDGVQVFMPGSLGGINKLLDFNSLIGQTIKVVPIKNENKYSKYRNQLIVSHRDYLKTLIPDEINKLEIGKVYTGRVTDTTSFGIFVEFNNVLTGLIHVDEFDEQVKELFDSKQIKPGTEIEFFLKEIVTNTKLILTRNEVDLDEINKPKFNIGDEVEGKVIKVVNYGCFVSLGKQTTGLLHQSKMKGAEIKHRDKIKVKILNNKNNKYDLDLV